MEQARRQKISSIPYIALILLGSLLGPYLLSNFEPLPETMPESKTRSTFVYFGAEGETRSVAGFDDKNVAAARAEPERAD